MDIRGCTGHESNIKLCNNRVPLTTLARVASVAMGAQFTWSLQFSLLTPYVQELGISHTFASYVWLCGPISGLLVQPIVGLSSDNMPSSWGRRRPFIMAGAILVIMAVLLVGFSSDIGYILGDSLETKTGAITIFILGFWLLDIANNALQVPCRALLADMTGKDEHRTRQGNTYYSLFLGVGSVLGFAAGSFNNWPMIFPFTQTQSCNLSCANLKSVFLVDILLLVFTLLVSVTAAEEIPWLENEQKTRYHSDSPSTPLLSGVSERVLENGGGLKEAATDSDSKIALLESVIWELFGIFSGLPKQMWIILFITALSWFALFSFLLYDTDWMGREVYKGAPNSGNYEQERLYSAGVAMGAFGLVLNSIVMGVFSLLIEPLCNRFRTSFVWTSANVLLAACLASTAVISIASKNATSYEWEADLPMSIKVAALVTFSLMGVPLALISSLPYALMATCTSSLGGGQGLSMGVVNLANVIPQTMVSVAIGPWDSFFGGGDMPGFILASAVAFLGAIFAAIVLPKYSPDDEVVEESLVLVHTP